MSPRKPAGHTAPHPLTLFFMKAATLALLLIAMTTTAAPIAIVIHGGAGNLTRANLSPAAQKERHIVLARALRAGHDRLKQGHPALDAVEAAIVVLEDSPLFNAGRGSVFTSAGENELDASIMDGRTLAAGAMGGVTTIKNPIRGARAVMERTPHVMLAGRGAEAFAKQTGLTIVTRKYFHTKHRWQQLQQWKARPKKKNQSSLEVTRDHLGTVGCVALDRNGNLAAGTSTGGLTGKQYGRIGDSPIIGAGTYADNSTCALSCTGHGEFFIRHAVAHDISARMKYKRETLATAAHAVIQETLKTAGGRGGVIGLDSRGNLVLEFNTPGMYRGSIGPKGKLRTAIFR